jgi:virulence-associated protein VagC
MTRTASLIRQGNDQWLLLPVEMHLAADRVRLRRHGRGIMLEPCFGDVKEWFGELDKFGPEPFPDVHERVAPNRRRR